MLEEIKKRLEEVTGRKYEVFNTVKNNGTVYTGLREVSDANKCISPTIYTDSFVQRLEVGKITLDDAVEEIIKAFARAEEEGKSFDIDNLFKWPAEIIPILVNKEKNGEFLEGVIHDDLPNTDLSVYYCVAVRENGKAIGRIKIDESVLKSLGCTLEEIREAANKYISEKTYIDGLTHYLAENFSREMKELLDIAPVEECMWIITNKDRCFGASSILNAYDELQKILGDNIIILPSSIHEVIAVKDNGDYQMMKSMVNQVNTEEVSDEDFLSSEIYRLTKEGLNIVKATEQKVAVA